MNDEIDPAKATLDIGIQPQEPRGVKRVSRTTCQAFSQSFGKSGHADEALPGFLPDLRLELVGLDIDSQDGGNWS
jgi:hypothetical protein